VIGRRSILLALAVLASLALLTLGTVSLRASEPAIGPSGPTQAQLTVRKRLLAEAADPILSRNCDCTAAARMRERVADGRVARARATSAKTP
jgi:hypothetical protein